MGCGYPILIVKPVNPFNSMTYRFPGFPVIPMDSIGYVDYDMCNDIGIKGSRDRGIEGSTDPRILGDWWPVGVGVGGHWRVGLITTNHPPTPRVKF